MKKALMTSVLSFALLLAAGVAAAQPGPGVRGGWGPGYSGPQGQGWFCPYCGSPQGWRGGMAPLGPGWTYGMGSHMMPHYGGMGPGMMHRWGGMGPGMMNRNWYGGPRYEWVDRDLGLDEARSMIEEYLDMSRNPNLKIGEIEEKGDVFEAEILTQKAGDLVDRIQIDKRRAWMRSVYE
ncbi:MAG: hypothetical protein K9M82_07200 [Deltaproteobacteria bacterium]|nr:hypothetical protein [Deltaproteobacteria bacterium]